MYKYAFLNKVFLLMCFFLFFVAVSFAVETKVKLSIIEGNLTLGAPSYLDLGIGDVLGEQQEISGQFDDYFWVEDLLGSNLGYVTTIVSDGLVGPYSDILTGIYLKSENIFGPQKIMGVDGNVLINSEFLTGFGSIYSDPKTYLYRPSGNNYGRINKYGDKPWIKILVPPYTKPGVYSGKIYFSIEDNT